MVGQPTNPGPEGRPREELESARDWLHPDGRAGGLLKAAELPQQGPGPGAVREPGEFCQAAGRERLAGEKQGRLEAGQFV